VPGCRAVLNVSLRHLPWVFLNLCGWSRERNNMARKPTTPTTFQAFGWALAEELSLRVVSAGKYQGSWPHRKPLVSGASADQVPSRWQRRDGPRGPEHFFRGAGNRADRRGSALHKASTASDGPSGEPPGVELIDAHMQPLGPSELHADWK
jgi:hypothetical protein